jgi:hypothetical protein
MSPGRSEKAASGGDVAEAAALRLALILEKVECLQQ